MYVINCYCCEGSL